MKNLPFLNKILTLLLIGLAIRAYPQQISYDKIDFQDNPEWSKVLRQAENTGKMIFLDGYTSWCIPCKKMEKEVFTRLQVANYFNQKFINVKYDMEAPAGVELKRLYDVRAFPTYLFINARGEVIHKILGAHTENDDFLLYAMTAATPGENFADLQKRYRNGERNSDLMFKYMRALKLAGEMDAEQEIVNSYLVHIGKDHFLDHAYWEIIKHFMNDPLSKPFRILLENRPEIAAVNGEKDVNGLIYRILNNQVKLNAAGYTKDGINFDRDAENKFIELLRKHDFPGRKELLARSMLTQYRRKGEWASFIFLMDAVIDFGLFDELESPLTEMDYFTNQFVKVVLDEALLAKALRWAEYTCEKAGPSSEKARFLRSKATILDKMGRKAEADLARAEAGR